MALDWTVRGDSFVGLGEWNCQELEPLKLKSTPKAETSIRLSLSLRIFSPPFHLREGDVFGIAQIEGLRGVKQKRLKVEVEVDAKKPSLANKHLTAFELAVTEKIFGTTKRVFVVFDSHENAQQAMESLCQDADLRPNVFASLPNGEDRKRWESEFHSWKVRMATPPTHQSVVHDLGKNGGEADLAAQDKVDNIDQCNRNGLYKAVPNIWEALKQMLVINKVYWFHPKPSDELLAILEELTPMRHIMAHNGGGTSHGMVDFGEFHRFLHTDN
ncbi:hypothetical protein IFR05_001702 [Cadophora sp. M221]|nr:hypothetical protein IFR05_001702 [Cadophora sp. M221]